MTGAELIAAERERQVYGEGYTAEHDAAAGDHVLTRAAECYLCWADALTADDADTIPRDEVAAGIWPWGMSDWKPSDDPIRNLVKAGALIAAEIDRLQA
jgi:hypothetical protein